MLRLTVIRINGNNKGNILFSYVYLAHLQIYINYLKNFSNDWIEIRDGGNQNATYLYEKLCGSITPDPIISTNNELFIRFVSGSDLKRYGYHIKVEEGKCKS